MTKIKANVPDENEVDYQVRLTLTLDGKVVEKDGNALMNDRKKRMQYRKEIGQLGPFLDTYVKFSVPDDLVYLNSPQAFELDEDGDVITDEFHEIRLFNQFEFLLETSQLVLDVNDSQNTSNIAGVVNSSFEIAVTSSNHNQALNTTTNIKEIRLNPNINV